jgi:hypothetical protein
VSCRSRVIHALGECNCFFKPRYFRELLENERRWFELLDALHHVRWRRTSLEENSNRPTGKP